MNKKICAIYITVTVVILFFVSHIVLINRIQKLSEEISDFDKVVKAVEIKVYNFERNLAASEENTDMQFQKLDVSIHDLYQKSEAQYSKTVVMSKTYDAILEEQKKKTIDTSEKDQSYLETKRNAIALYKKGSFSIAYDEFNRLTKNLMDDMECRMYKAKSLYYKNRADSSSYAEVLEDISILKQNGVADVEVLEIERSILTEKDGLDE